MARVTETDVQEIMEDTFDSSFDATPFIKLANLLVNTHLLSVGYTTELLFELERWIAAHYIDVRNKQIIKEKLGEAEVTYANTFGKQLEATSYGQVVLSLDSSGTLQSLGKPACFVKAVYNHPSNYGYRSYYTLQD